MWQCVIMQSVQDAVVPPWCYEQWDNSLVTDDDDDEKCSVTDVQRVDTFQA